MAVFRILGNEVVTKAAFIERSSGFETGGNADLHPLSAEFATGRDTAARPAATRFVPIGPGLPLTILIRHVYTGNEPKSLFGGAKPMVLVSGLKDYSVYAPASRAVNFLLPSVGPNSHFKAPPTFDSGTNVVAYSPAVLTDSFHFTVEMSFDKFPSGLFATISGALSKSAGIPLLMPAAGYLLAASTVISTGAEWVDALVDGRATFSQTDTFDFNLPGVVPPSADFRIMCGFDASGMKYVPGQGLMTAKGTLYDGDGPYVVISLDGAPRKNLEGFSATVATAGILKQFFNMRDGVEASAEAILSGIRLVNDMKYRDEAVTLKSQIATAQTAAQKAELEKRLEAVQKNILNSELKKI